MKIVRTLSVGAAWALACVLLTPAHADNTDLLDRWVKYNAKGNALKVEEGPWVCVLDKRTGLTWENLTDNEGLRYEDATYSWYDVASNKGARGQGTCMKADRSTYNCDTADLVAAANRDRWCGVDGWRLPDLKELQGLLYDTGYEGGARIATGYFVNTGRRAFWTSTTRASPDRHGELEAALVHFGTGEQNWLRTTHAARLRLVTSAAPAASVPTPGSKASNPR